MYYCGICYTQTTIYMEGFNPLEQAKHRMTRTEIFNAAYERAQSGRGQEQIDIHDFVDVHGAEAVEKDSLYASELRALQEEKHSQRSMSDQESTKTGPILEALVTEQIELSEWFGPGVETRKTTDYDDIKNGVDTVAEINRDNSRTHLAVAIDVTLNSTRLNKKFKGIRAEVGRGALAHVKYYENGDGEKGSLENIPRVVLGASSEVVHELARLWIEDGHKKELAQHPIQMLFLNQIHSQLIASRALAETKNKEHLLPIFDEQIKIVEDIIIEKEEMGLSRDALADDKINRAIQMETRRLYSEF